MTARKPKPRRKPTPVERVCRGIRRTKRLLAAIRAALEDKHAR